MKYIITLEKIDGKQFTVLQEGANKYDAMAKARENHTKTVCEITKNVFPIVYQVVPDRLL